DLAAGHLGDLLAPLDVRVDARVTWSRGHAAETDGDRGHVLQRLGVRGGVTAGRDTRSALRVACRTAGATGSKGGRGRNCQGQEAEPLGPSGLVGNHLLVPPRAPYALIRLAVPLISSGCRHNRLAVDECVRQCDLAEPSIARVTVISSKRSCS